MATKAARKPKSNEHTVCFVIHGEDFTRIARERLLDDNPGSAWRIASSLSGESAGAGKLDAALAILKGEKKLIGNSTDGMELVDEDPHVAKIHRERIEWLYAGRIRVQDKWYCPVANVTTWGVRDMSNKRGIPVNRAGAVGSGLTGYTNRTWHYCFDGEIAPCCDKDSMHTPVDNYGVIFRSCGELPHWMTPPRDADAAIEQWKAAERGLEERGHTMWYADNGESLSGFAALGEDILRVRDDDDDDDEDEKEEEALAPTREQRKQEQLEQLKLSDERDRLEEEARVEFVVKLREKILAQAGDDLLDLVWEEEKVTDEEREKNLAWHSDWKPMPGGSAKVPRAPFMRWAFDRMPQYKDALPPWETISPMGMKRYGLDNRNHTDWVIGAGFDPRSDMIYKGPMYDAALELSWKLQRQYRHKAEVHVLVAGEVAFGTVVHGKPNTEVEPGSVVVLPNLHPRYLKAMLNAVAIITEEGGSTAHLAQVGRERSLPIVRVPGALDKYEEDMQVAVNTHEGRVDDIALIPKGRP